MIIINSTKSTRRRYYSSIIIAATTTATTTATKAVILLTRRAAVAAALGAAQQQQQQQQQQPRQKQTSPQQRGGRIKMNHHYHTVAERKYMEYRKHPALFKGFDESWLHPDMIQLVKTFKESTETTTTTTPTTTPVKDLLDDVIPKDLLRKETTEVYSFRCFNAKFVDMFNEEIAHFYDIAEKYNINVRRPNSMNNYGVVINEIGMKPLIDEFQNEYLWIVARILFPQQASQFDDHHTFIVRYNSDEDLGLDMHVDDSDVTFNVCLGHNFTGATLSFCGMLGTPEHRQWIHTYNHEVGRAVLHLGNRRHGADDITEGTRANLIVWNHNYEWRNTIHYKRRMHFYEKEKQQPHPVCVSYTHDRDYNVYRTLPANKMGIKFHPWCPPPGLEYDEFDNKMKQYNEEKKKKKREDAENKQQQQQQKDDIISQDEL